MTLYGSLQASNCIYGSQSAPAEGSQPPLNCARTIAVQHCPEINFA